MVTRKVLTAVCFWLLATIGLVGGEFGDDLPVSFEDASKQAGIEFKHINGSTPQKFMPETMGSGGLFFDFNNDGWPDIFLVNGGSFVDDDLAKREHALYQNNKDGTFRDVTANSGIRKHAYGMGACSADYDNDGWVDLYVTNYGPNALYRNNGDGTFTDVTARAGVGTTLWSTSCAFGDVNDDGAVDLFVTNYVDFSVDNNKFCGDSINNIRGYCHPNVYNGLPDILYRNNQDGTFTDVTKESGIYTTAGKGLGVVFSDVNNDEWLDIYVANDSVPNFLFLNKGQGFFEEGGMWAGVAVAADGMPRAGMGTDIADTDNDGLTDILVTNLDRQTHNFFRNLGGGIFADNTFQSGVAEATMPFVGFGALFLDYDNDRDLDLSIANGNVLDNAVVLREGTSYEQRNLLLRNDGKAVFKDVSLTSGSGFALVKVSRALHAADIDNDGDSDLLITNNGQTADLLRNNGGHCNNSVLIRTIGTKSNRDGIGARLELRTGNVTQIREVKAGSSYLGQSDLRVSFGLGSASEADRLEVRWPSGGVDVIEKISANQIVTVIEGKGLAGRAAFERKETPPKTKP